jgi:hypothetical protein
MEVPLEVGGFYLDGSVEMTMTQVHINVHKHDLGEEVIKAFKELGEGVGTMRPKEENIIDKTQPEAGFLENGVKEILLKETHEEVSTVGDHLCVHGSSHYLEVMLAVEREMVVGENKLGKLDKELSGW